MKIPLFKVPTQKLFSRSLEILEMDSCLKKCCIFLNAALNTYNPSIVPIQYC